MLPDVGGVELLVIAAVALIVVGPKDLPALLRKVGQFVGRMRSMAAEFRASFDEMARQSELDELRKEVEAMRRGQALAPGLSDMDAEVKATFSDIDRGLQSGEMQLHPPMSHQYESPDADPDEEETPPVMQPLPPMPTGEAEPAPIDAADKPARKPRAPRKKADGAVSPTPRKRKPTVEA